jgi:Protein of unknown function (DUF3618)
MGEEPGQERAQQLMGDDGQKSAAQLRAEIEDVREDLGETAAALAAKTDVKARVHDRTEEIKRNATAKKDELLGKAPGGGSASGGGASAALESLRTTAREHPIPTAVLAGLLAGFVLGRLTSGGDDDDF